MRYGSVCSGVEAASMAWEPLGWKPVFFSEIEEFPSAVLAKHWPDVPNHGDMTKFEEWGYESGDIDVLVGGTPCQSFSIAGMRGGLDDDRGNLALTYMRMVDQLRPRWTVWENVPGVLSANGGRDFGSIVGALAELGYSCAWRVLDAQNFGVPQRRRRVFLIGCSSGDWRDPSQVLFERPESDRILHDEQTARDQLPCFKTVGGGISLERLSHLVFDGKEVRKLTPLEWERCFGFPDGHTDIGWNGKPTPDSHRYKAMGNSMAVPVMNWIGRRIQEVEDG